MSDLVGNHIVGFPTSQPFCQGARIIYSAVISTVLNAMKDSTLCHENECWLYIRSEANIVIC